MITKLLFTSLFLFSLSPSYAQLFSNAAANLPSIATKQSMDIRAADLDGDADLDIILANEFQSNTILLNNGAGIFTNGTPSIFLTVAHDSEDIAIADYDQDGDLDLIFCSEDDQVHEYYLNDGNGDFAPAPFQFPNSIANAIITADINGDELPDVLFGNNGQNSVFINHGDGTFENETLNRIPTLNDATQDIQLADVDKDGDLDLLIGNEVGQNRLLFNNGLGVFEEKTSTHLPAGLSVETRKITLADVDGDDDLDAFYSNVDFSLPNGNALQNLLFINDGTGVFTDETNTRLPIDTDFTLDGIFTDYDLDADLDLVTVGIRIVNNSIAADAVRVLENDGDGNFTEVTNTVLGNTFQRHGLGVFAADFNGDNLEDFYVCDRNTGNNLKDLLFLKNMADAVEEYIMEDQVQVFPNPSAGTFSIKMLIKGDPTFQLLTFDGQLIQELIPVSKTKNTYQFDVSKAKNLPLGQVFLIKINIDNQELIKNLMLR